jgi:transposase
MRALPGAHVTLGTTTGRGKRDRNPALLEIVSSKTKDPAPKQPQKGHGPRPQPQLAMLDVPHEMDAADQICKSCGGHLDPWDGQFEESEEIDVIERQFVIKKHRRQKYRCTCGACIETAPGPLKLFEGARYSIDFAVDVAVQKYLDHP